MGQQPDAAIDASIDIAELDAAAVKAAAISKSFWCTAQRAGWQRLGAIPDYAMWPGGGFCDTTVFWKKI